MAILWYGAVALSGDDDPQVKLLSFIINGESDSATITGHVEDGGGVVSARHSQSVSASRQRIPKKHRSSGSRRMAIVPIRLFSCPRKVARHGNPNGISAPILRHSLYLRDLRDAVLPTRGTRIRLKLCRIARGGAIESVTDLDEQTLIAHPGQVAAGNANV